MVAQRTQQAVRVGQIETQVAVTGSGEPLVYLHGAFAHRAWPSFLDTLAERFTVYAPLHPGFGEADGIDQIDDLLDLTLYHYDLLDALGLQAPNIVGHFFGAMIAAEMAALCPHRVGKLVLAAPAGLWLDDNPGVDYFATPANELPGILFRDKDSAVAKATMPEAETDDERGVQALERVRALSTVGKFLWPIPDKGLAKRLGRIKSPTLVVVGEDDKIVPAVYGDEVTKRVATATLHTVSGAGHLFPLERPDEFAGAVSEFLAG